MQDTSGSENASGSQTSSEESSTEAHLEALTQIFITACEDSESPDSQDILRRFCAPKFESVSKADNMPWLQTTTLDQLIAGFSYVKRENPAWRTSAYNISAVVDRSRTWAVVWFTSDGTGDPGSPGDVSTHRESVSRLYWRLRKTDGQWECYGHEFIRGSNFGDGLVT